MQGRAITAPPRPTCDLTSLEVIVILLLVIYVWDCFCSAECTHVLDDKWDWGFSVPPPPFVPTIRGPAGPLSWSVDVALHYRARNSTICLKGRSRSSSMTTYPARHLPPLLQQQILHSFGPTGPMITIYIIIRNWLLCSTTLFPFTCSIKFTGKEIFSVLPHSAVAYCSLNMAY